MRLDFVEVCGFRGYRKRVRIDFARDFTVIDGRNGVGKSTIFDAVEFALTGTIAKYRDLKADGESVDDYIWWRGGGRSPEGRYVMVGFQVGAAAEPVVVRRDRLDPPGRDALGDLQARLIDGASAPRTSLAQLCTTSIIRDERIAELSLDLKEAERYALVYNAIGAPDSDALIKRAAAVLSALKHKTKTAEREAETANEDVAVAMRRFDEARASIPRDPSYRTAVDALQNAVGSVASDPQRLIALAEDRIAGLRETSENLRRIGAVLPLAISERDRRDALSVSITANNSRATSLEDEIAAAAEALGESDKTELTQKARDLAALAAVGRRLALKQDTCPLCGSKQDHGQLAAGVAAAETLAGEIDAKAAVLGRMEDEVRGKRQELAELQQTLAREAEELAQITLRADTVAGLLESAALEASLTPDQLTAIRIPMEQAISSFENHVRTVRAQSPDQLAAVEHAANGATAAYARAEQRLGQARNAEATAKALEDAAKRAAGEAIQRRLERVLPLISELYARLRPHPAWDELDYKIRGDINRFLRLKVGDALNPQFMFSSGQRRATGLAFLLAVNLSMTWNRWKTIMLDDPVQHIDDYRSVHLVEVLAHLVAKGRQIICAVEDPALGDLIARRLPVSDAGSGRHVTLGTDSDGALAKLSDKELHPLVNRALVSSESQQETA